MKSFDIDTTRVGENCPPYIVAEISANHNGSIDEAKKIIIAAKESGANAIKLQTYTPDTMTIKSDKEDFKIKGGLWDGYTLYDLYHEAHTPYDWHKELFELSAEIGITCFSSPFDESAIDFLEDLNAPAYKIASFEATDLSLIKYAASTKKPLIISTGMANLDEISEIVETAKNSGCEKLVLLHCVSSYPAPVEEVNLRTIPDLKDRFNVNIGLSDHTLTNSAAIASIAIGACLIEKHFIFSRELTGPDSTFSIEPQELKELVVSCKDAWLSLGKADYSLKNAEKENIKFRRSIYFIKDLRKGDKISPADIKKIRPGYGLPPKYIDKVLGLRLKEDVKRGTPLSWEILDIDERNFPTQQ